MGARGFPHCRGAFGVFQKQGRWGVDLSYYFSFPITARPDELPLCQGPWFGVVVDPDSKRMQGVEFVVLFEASGEDQLPGGKYFRPGLAGGQGGLVSLVSGCGCSESVTALVLQRRFLNLVSFWPETASRRAKVTKSVAS